MDSFAVRPHDPDVNIQESTLSHLEHEAHLGARLHLRDTVRDGDRDEVVIDASPRGTIWMLLGWW